MTEFHEFVMWTIGLAWYWKAPFAVLLLVFFFAGTGHRDMRR